MREQAALETAIRRMEAEARAGQSQTRKKAGSGAGAAPDAAADAQERADNTARSLSKILQAVQPDETERGRGARPSQRERHERDA